MHGGTDLLGEIDHDDLQLALEELPPEYKLVVTMFYFEHCSYKDIAEQLGLPIGTVMSRLSRAREKLRGVLGPWMTGSGR